MNAVIWDSEGDPAVADVKDDPMYIAVDGDDGVLRVNDYKANGMHITTMLFIGPNADGNAKKFAEFVKAEDMKTIDINTQTEEAIKRCFGIS